MKALDLFNEPTIIGPTQIVTLAIEEERARQDGKWGQQNHPDGTGSEIDLHLAEQARTACEYHFRNGQGAWRHILREEVFEAFAESDPDRLVEELVQVAAVAVAWVEAIKRRQT